MSQKFVAVTLRLVYRTTEPAALTVQALLQQLQASTEAPASYIAGHGYVAPFDQLLDALLGAVQERPVPENFLPKFMGNCCAPDCPYLGKYSTWGRCRRYGGYRLQQTDVAFLRNIDCLHDPDNTEVTASTGEVRYAWRTLPGEADDFLTRNNELVARVREGEDIWAWLLLDVPPGVPNTQAGYATSRKEAQEHCLRAARQYFGD